MKNINETKKPYLEKLYKDLQSIYTLIEIEQEALNTCCENEKDPTHIITLSDIILKKFKTTLKEFEIIAK